MTWLVGTRCFHWRYICLLLLNLSVIEIMMSLSHVIKLWKYINTCLDMCYNLQCFANFILALGLFASRATHSCLGFSRGLRLLSMKLLYFNRFPFLIYISYWDNNGTTALILYFHNVTHIIYMITWAPLKTFYFSS